MSELATLRSDRKPGPTLAEALSGLFGAELEDAEFANRLAHLTATLTNSPEVFVLALDEGSVLANVGADRPSEAAKALFDGLSGEEGQSRDARANPSSGGILIVLPSSQQAALIIRLPPGGTVAGALALERLTLLGTLSEAAHNNSREQAVGQVLEALTSQKIDLKVLSDAVQTATDADYVAIGQISGSSVSDLALSGQPKATTRAPLPDKLHSEFPAIARAHGETPGHSVAVGAGGTFVIRLERPARNPGLGQVVVQALATGQGVLRQTRARALRRVLRWGLALGAIAVLAFVPLPEGQRIAAEVVSVEERVVTSPISGVLTEIYVRENDTVKAGETLLAEFDTSLLNQELIAVQADHGKALLERETARAGRDATALRNAELEVERFRSQIDLLTARRESARLVAGIDGVIAGDGLGDLKGATLRQGDTILRILDPMELRLSIEISDEAVGDLPDGAQGIFRPDFNPSLHFPATITSISPALSERKDIAVFSGRAAIEGDTAGLSPGLRGVIAIKQDWRPAWQIFSDAVEKWLLLRLWF